MDCGPALSVSMAVADAKVRVTCSKYRRFSRKTLRASLHLLCNLSAAELYPWVLHCGKKLTLSHPLPLHVKAGLCMEGISGPEQLRAGPPGSRFTFCSFWLRCWR